MLLRKETLPKGKTLLRLAGMGAIGYVGQSFSYLTAIKYASAGLVALLLYLYPAIVAVLSILILKEKINKTKIFAITLALAGTALTVSPEGGKPLGIILGITAAVIYSFYIIVGTDVMKKVTATQSSTVIFFSASAVYGVLMAANQPHFPATAQGWWVIAGTVLVATIIPVITFLAGLQRIGPTNASMLSTLEPVVTVLLAAILFNERLQPISLAGGGMIILAVLLLATAELGKNNTHAN